MNTLDDWMRTASPEIEAPLGDLERDVWRRVEAYSARRATMQVRLAALAVALTVGVVNGSVGGASISPPSSEMTVFSSSGFMSPLTRIEAG